MQPRQCPIWQKRVRSSTARDAEKARLVDIETATAINRIAAPPISRNARTNARATRSYVSKIIPLVGRTTRSTDPRRWWLGPRYLCTAAVHRRIRAKLNTYLPRRAARRSWHRNRHRRAPEDETHSPRQGAARRVSQEPAAVPRGVSQRRTSCRPDCYQMPMLRAIRGRSADIDTNSCPAATTPFTMSMARVHR